jgi:putative spermidine/putrescine transport system permease protein
MTHYMLPYAVLPLYTAMSSVDQRLVAAARGMGASKAQAFLRVFLPLTKAGIIGAGTLVFIFSLGFYVTPAIMGGGRVLMVAEYTSVQILEVLNWGGGTTISIAMIVAICLLLGVIEKVAGLRELIGVKETR